MPFLVLKRLAPTEVAWFRAPGPGAEEADARGPRLDDRLVVRATGSRSRQAREIRLRWFDGRRMVEQHRRLVCTGELWFLEGPPLSGRRLSRATEGDVLVISVQRVRDVTGGSRSLLTIDAWMGDDLDDEEIAGPIEAVLQGKASAGFRADDDHPVFISARQHLPAFGSHLTEAQALAPREHARVRRWLVAHLRGKTMRSILQLHRDADVDRVLELLGGEATPRKREELATALLHRYGNDLLSSRRRRKLILAERFPDRSRRPEDPGQWVRGSKRARALTQALDLPPVMAGAPVPAASDLEDVVALAPLGELHDYQRQIASGLREVLHAEDWRERRAVVWLPTGTGKTRVCVETLLMELLLASPRNVILWIADRGELCEQAIEALRHVWLMRGTETPAARGLSRPALRVMRLWGGRSHQEPTSAPTVVVASIQTLARRVEDREFEGVLAKLGRRCAAVVFDEAHHAVAPTYARVIDALGLGESANVLGDDREEGPPLLGLTATPGRTRQDETDRLVERFAGTLLEPDAPYRSIEGFIAGGYLSRPRLEVVPTGYMLEEAATRDDAWSRYDDLPLDTVRKAGDHPGRTALIVQDLLPRLDDLHSVLVFACSVHHAEVLAEVLSRRGVRAEALHGDSPRALRQSAIRRFRERALQVLVTCDLLTTGFDAPNVEAVVLARPVQSPVLFSQMVGRGLRGPKNGGTDDCLLLDYEDSIGPFHSLERLRTQFRAPFSEREDPAQTA